MMLKKHPKPIPDVLPPLEYVTKYLVNDPHGSDHVFWHDGRANHLHDRDGLALLRWRVKPTVRTRCVSQGVYVVVRLLLDHQKIDVEEVENACGLPQCVNPKHWRARARIPPFRFARGAAGWMVIAARTERGIDAPVALRVRSLEGTVHVLRAAPGQLEAAVCGAPIDPATSVIVESMVTCKGGC